jgi:hypothetical protein
MKLPPDVTFFEAWKSRGILNEATINKITAFVGEQEATFGKPFNRFTDMSYAGRPKMKSAFYVCTPAAAHYAIITDHSPLNVALFEEREPPRNGLGVPVGVFTAE